MLSGFADIAEVDTAAPVVELIREADDSGKIAADSLVVATAVAVSVVAEQRIVCVEPAVAGPVLAASAAAGGLAPVEESRKRREDHQRRLLVFARDCLPEPVKVP